MSEWKKCKLGNVCVQVFTGGTPLTKKIEYYVNGKIPWLRTKEVNFCKINNTENYISELGLANSAAKLVPVNSVIVAMYGQGDTAGRVAINKIPLATNQACCNLVIDNDVADYQFIYYLLKNSYFELVQRKTGSAQPNLNTQMIKDFDISLPSLPEQHAIASILSSLDDKIDLLHHQNKTLEALAETLFRQWFVEEAVEDGIGMLGDYVDCINGYSYKSSELNPSKNALVTLKSFDRNGGFSMEGFKEFIGKIKPLHVVQEGDLVVAHTDITQEAEVIGNPALVVADPKFEKLVISMDLVKVVPLTDWISKEFLYFLMRTREFKYHCLGCANGTTVLHLNKEAIPTFEFPIPDKNKVIEFTKQAKELIQKIFINHKQIHNLISTREILLPKLMSGEVRVKM
ncbi:MAG TPA: restriction endonuclease subunit S [Candidatus Methanoperedens sp.]